MNGKSIALLRRCRPRSKSNGRILLEWTACLLLIQSAAFAQSTNEELRKVARNPFANAIELQFEEDVTGSQGPFDRTANSLQILTLLPLPITNRWLLIARVLTGALVYQPNPLSNFGGTTGSSDTTVSFFLTPAHTRTLIWGLGPVALFPTASSDELGLGKWGLGPTAALLVQPKWGFAGVLVQNIWSVAGGSKRPSVNQMQAEPLFSYNLPEGWYLTSNPTIAADWRQPASERWLVPVGGGAGKSFSIGKQGVDLNLTVYWNAVRPANQFLPEWQVSLQFMFIFPQSSSTPTH